MIKKYHYNYKDKLDEIISGELKSIYLPSNITEISAYTFNRCKNLEKVVITNSIKKIEVDAFTLCNNLKEFIFEGTISEWNSINKSKGWADSSLIIQCKDGNITVT